jgi:hypothetical protein
MVAARKGTQMHHISPHSQAPTRRLLPLLAVLMTAALFAPPAMARTLEVGPNKEFKMPSEAAAKAQDGDTVTIAPGEYFDCATWKANNLTIEGTGPDATAVITDKTCAGKGLFLTNGTNITVRNLTLQRARVNDMNGAGIRMQANDLTVDHVKFINNQNGILSNIEVRGHLIIRDSEFIKNGTCEHGCAHGVYVGGLDLLRVEHTKFYETQHAHSIKSRAKRTEVVDCNIADGPEGNSSYLIEIPNGGSVLISGNTLEKGPKAENRSTAIAIGTEGITQPTPDIVIENNTFHDDGDYSTVFVTNRSATPVILKGNKLFGQVKPLVGDGTVVK